MQFSCRLLNLDSPTSITSFWSLVLPKSILIGIKGSHNVSQLQSCGTSGDIDIAVLTQGLENIKAKSTHSSDGDVNAAVFANSHRHQDCRAQWTNRFPTARYSTWIPPRQVWDFLGRVYKILGSTTSTTKFWDVVFQMSISTQEPLPPLPVLSLKYISVTTLGRLLLKQHPLKQAICSFIQAF